MAKPHETRSVRLPLAPLTPETVQPFGRFEQDSGSELSPASPVRKTGPVRRVRRREGREVQLELRQGERVILGPASDPMRCRALPSEREFRAYEAVTDGILRIAPGVWFTDLTHTPRSSDKPEDGVSDPATDEERDLGALFDYHLELPERLEPGPFPFPGKVGLGHLRNPKDSEK